jgi:cytochrome P450
MWLLLSHPAEIARLRSEPALLGASIEEMLRYEGPIQLNNRRLTAPVKIGGANLPAGDVHHDRNRRRKPRPVAVRRA